MRNPYTVLGVPVDAAKDEIKGAFRRLAKTLHPDQNREDFGAQERFAEINAAYQILGNAQKRKMFDLGLIDARGRRTPTGAPGTVRTPFTGFTVNNAKVEPETKRGETPEDVIERIFGGAYKRDAADEMPRERQAEPARTRIHDTPGLDDVPIGDPDRDAGERGGTRKRRPWSLFGISARQVFNLGGRQPEVADDTELDLAVTIEEVMAGGRRDVELADGSTISVGFAIGVADGEIMRLRGQGLAETDQVPGDLVITIRYRRHDSYRRDGLDIHVDLAVTLEEAIFGVTKSVTTPNGEASVEVPAWSGSDRSIVLAGQGLVDAEGRRGDFVADVRVMLSATPDEKLIDLFRLRKGDWYV